VTVHVPLAFKRKAGRKRIVVPEEWFAGASRKRSDQPNQALIAALARAFRWKKLIDTGVYTTVDEMASAERVNPSYLSRVLRLTLLAPEIVEEILDGRAAAPLRKLLEPFSVHWAKQRSAAGLDRCSPRRASLAVNNRTTK
jgi:hypothetical protein